MEEISKFSDPKQEHAKSLERTNRVEKENDPSNEATELAKKVLEKLYHPIANKLEDIRNELSSEFETIRSKGGWMFHENNFTEAINDANEIILKNGDRGEVSENIEKIKILLEQYRSEKQTLQNYLNMGIHEFLMSAIDDPSAGITVKDIKEVLNERAINI